MGGVGAPVCGFKEFMGNAKIKKFDKTHAKYVSTKFKDGSSGEKEDEE